jgi:hypothetical protein
MQALSLTTLPPAVCPEGLSHSNDDSQKAPGFESPTLGVTVWADFHKTNTLDYFTCYDLFNRFFWQCGASIEPNPHDIKLLGRKSRTAPISTRFPFSKLI